MRRRLPDAARTRQPFSREAAGGIKNKNGSLLSILAVPDDYRMNGAARKTPQLVSNKGDGR
jgi:hypothetical protein